MDYSYYIIYAEAAAFAASLAAWKVIRANPSLRLYPLLLFIIVAVEGYVTFFIPLSQPVNAWIYNIQVPLQHMLYLAILYYTLENPAARSAVRMAGFCLPVLAIITGLYLQNPARYNVWAYCFGVLPIIAGITAKFYEMLKHPQESNFLRVPFFYMLFAYLLFLLATLPYFAMANWLGHTKQSLHAVKIAINVMTFLNYILYSTYTIAFLWMKMKGSCL